MAPFCRLPFELTRRCRPGPSGQHFGLNKAGQRHLRGEMRKNLLHFDPEDEWIKENVIQASKGTTIVGTGASASLRNCFSFCSEVARARTATCSHADKVIEA